MAKPLLLEIGTEELPPASLSRLGQALLDQLGAQLKAARLNFDAHASRWFASPRRLAVLIAELDTHQPEEAQDRRGPAVSSAFDAEGNPGPAATGFARSAGVPVEALERVATDKGEYLVHRHVAPGQSLQALLPDLVQAALKQLPIGKRMRWGDNDFEFVRPVHWMVALHGDEVVDLELFKIHSGRDTQGHRFHADGSVRLANARSYESSLQKAYVIADFGKRRQQVREQVEALATAGTPVLSDSLLDEVTALTEWPQALACHFDASFLDLPPEVIVITLEYHQRFFPVLDANGRPTRQFIAVANIDSTEPDVVRSGFERVVRPRLADAVFFYEQDKNTPLIDRRDALKGMLFHKLLGSQFDKSERIVALSRLIAEQAGQDIDVATRAAALCKCDLTTHMVGEFPELQGTMGQYYAQHDREPEAVARAVGEHYEPRFSGDGIPATQAGRVVALADKLDTVCGVIHAVGKPGGNKDPFGLRRQALGVVRLFIEGALDMDLASLIDKASAPFQSLPGSGQDESVMRDFIMERLRGYYREQGVPMDAFEAVRATGTTHLMDFHHRLQACLAFRAMPQAASLAAANKRVRNILKQADGAYPSEPDSALLEEPAERALFEAVTLNKRVTEPLLQQADYQQALTQLSALRDPVDAFFDQVLVMADDEAVCNNRLALLAVMADMFLSIADVSQLELEAAK